MKAHFNQSGRTTGERKKALMDGGFSLTSIIRVADAVHEVSPSTHIGGPAAAYMQLHQKDFGLFRDHARFIKETRGKLDFFSYHFYENAGTLGAHERRGQGYANYLLGRYEATLDALRAEMHNVENVLPILITECGSLQNGRQAADNWLRVLAWNAFLTKTMQRPDQIGLFVPFVFLHMPWNPSSGDAVFTPKDDRQQHMTIDDFHATPIANFFELWRDFDGHRLPVTYDRDWLDVVAVHSNNKISLAVTNMGGRQLLVDLSSILEQHPEMSARQTRLNYHEGDLTFQPDQPVEVDAIPVDVNETTVIHLVQQQRAFNRHKGCTRTGTTQEKLPSKARANQSLSRSTTPKGASTTQAQLVIGVHRTGGLNTPLKTTINEIPMTIDVGDSR